MQMNKRLLFASLVASLGGFLFGFDTAVISGAEQSVKEVFQLEGFWHGFTIATALIGTIYGAMLAGIPGDKFGRRNTLVVLAVFYTVSALGSALADSWFSFMLYRFLGGLGVGGSSVLGPMYISEISPVKPRGRLVAVFQFNIVFGILLAFFSNYVIDRISANDAWRWMLGIESIPALLFFILLFTIPESPRWLIKMHLREEAGKVLQLTGTANVDLTLVDIEESLNSEKLGNIEKLFSKKYLFPIMLAVLLATFNQFSGINAIMYYAPRIFGMTGLAKDTSLLQAVAIGITNMLFTIFAMAVIDRFGRKTLLIAGSFGMIIFQALNAITFYFQHFTGYTILIFMIGFIACFAFSQGAVIWVFLSEVFPNAVRSKGQALGSLTHWVWAALITWTFPHVAESKSGGAVAFSFFTIAMILQLLFVWKILPETKGKSLEQLQKEILY
jgi:sugar porter (SP) family MFS transporter